MASQYTKLTPRLQDGILELVRDGGIPYVVAAQKFGIAAETARQWRQGENIGITNRRRRCVEPYRSFAIRLKQAEADAEAKHVLGIVQTAVGGKKRIERRTEIEYAVTRDESGALLKVPVKERTYTVEREDEGQWTARAWLLERSPATYERWVRKDKVEVSTDIIARIVAMPDQDGSIEDWERRAAAVLALRAAQQSGQNGTTNGHAAQPPERPAPHTGNGRILTPPRSAS